MIEFLTTAFITNILFGISICGFIYFIGKKVNLSSLEIIVLSLGLSPGLTALLLNYLLWVLPNNNNQFYVISVISFFLLIALIFNKYIVSFFKMTFKEAKNVDKFLKTLGLVIFLFGLIFWTKTAVTKQILAHDMLNYAVQGKMFYRHPKVEYKDTWYYPDVKFEYRGRHGFSFPLLLTWENFLTDAIFGHPTDYYFSGIPTYYWFFTLHAIFALIRRFNKNLAMLIPVSFALVPMYSGLLFFMGLDTFRLFFQVCAFAFLLLLVEENKLEHLVLAGIFGGIAANAHSLGAVIVGVFFIVYLFFANASSKKRFIYLILFMLLVLVFGGLHYVIDLTIGSGWVFAKLPS